jgi:D-tagatose-1,6-bisphosphate aldolase subunit GatZ/KbaZ
MMVRIGSQTTLGKWRALAQRSGATLLAVCPTSEAVLDASLVAAHRHRFQLLLAATLNQVDLDGGYTGWTPETFVAQVHERIAQRRLDVRVAMCLDHGGAFQKDLQVKEGWGRRRAIDAVKHSIRACIAAGYDLLHIDATRWDIDRAAGLDELVESTVKLIAFAEACRGRQNRDPIVYEVGSDEVDGGVTEPGYLTEFLTRLRLRMHEAGLRAAWPLFVVARLGTNLHTHTFDVAASEGLATEAARFDVSLKGHYTDFVDDLSAYPERGVGGANVGPELAWIEYRALLELERHLGIRAPSPSCVSHIVQVVLEESGRVAKWLDRGESGRSLAELDEARADLLTGTGARYVWNDGRVRQARSLLYRVATHQVDARQWVEGRILSVLERYVDAFHLSGLLNRYQAAAL